MDDSNTTFPFGRPATPRPPRRPVRPAQSFVLGVYPSALHVRWTPPTWARQGLGLATIGALAVDDEPTVFWDGTDASDRVSSWRDAVGFRAGDEPGRWGSVTAAGNGTSGRSVADHVLRPLRIDPAATWFSDAVDRFFVKHGAGQQGDVIAKSYAPFAARLGLPAASLPRRPSPAALVALAVSESRDRLRSELIESEAPMVVTLGEEARRVLAHICDDVEGPPTRALDSHQLAPTKYGEAGEARIGARKLRWHALVHPGQRSKVWASLHDDWTRRVVARERRSMEGSVPADPPS